MPRYPDRTRISRRTRHPHGRHLQQLCRRVIDHNTDFAVTWIKSYTTPDRKRTYCIYDGPSPEALRRAADSTSCR